MTPPAIPHAATVLLLREADSGLQVLMTKRAPGLTFMAGLWVVAGLPDPCGAVPPSLRGAIIHVRIRKREGRIRSILLRRCFSY